LVLGLGHVVSALQSSAYIESTSRNAILGQSITSSIVKSLSEASFGLMGWGEVK